MIFGLLTKPATSHLITIHVVSIDQKGTRLVNGVTALMAEQKMVQRTYLVEATDTSQRPSPSRSDIQEFHSIDRRMQQSQLVLGYLTWLRCLQE